MANLKVSIFVRVSGPNGKRSWVPATGKNDPNGPLYLCYYKGSSNFHVRAGIKAKEHVLNFGLLQLADKFFVVHSIVLRRS